MSLPKPHKSLYITEQGASLKKDHETIVVYKDAEVLFQAPLKDIRIAVIFGGVQVSTQAMLALLENGTDISFLTLSGHFRGRMCSALSKNSVLREQQFQKSQIPEFILSAAKAFVTGKMKNGIALLKKYHYNQNNPVRIDDFPEMEDLIVKANQTDNIDSLRGYEGAFSKRYFANFKKCLTQDFGFNGRAYFPSTDCVNALLSFGYSFIAREMQGILEALTLDPYVGFFHQIKYGRASLSYDMIEEYRHILIDRLVLKIFNTGILTPENFYSDPKDGSHYLHRDSIKIFIKYYEEAMDTTNVTYQSDEKISYRKVFFKQVEKLRDAIEKDMPYNAFLEA